MKLLAAIVRSLEARRIPHALIGAAAMAAHGVARSTLDIDLLTTDPTVLNRAFWQDLDLAGTVDLRPGAADDPLAGVVRVSAPGDRDVDVVVGRGAWQADLITSAVRVDLGHLSVPVVQTAGLILLKLYAGGSQDAWDIEQLLAAADDRDTLARDVDALIIQLPSDARELWKRLRG